MSQASDRDYVLGTHDEELERLGIQHAVWRDTVLECWKAAGLRDGSRVLDVGAGPGYATLDLASIVGPRGEVVAVERSERFMRHSKAACDRNGLANVRFHELDLMTDSIPDSGFDLAWCRWVACFVSSPRKLVAELARVVRPGGKVVFHEYADYATWRLLKRSESMRAFVRHVMKSWRDNGGEPDIARDLPAMLIEEGFALRSTIPRVFCTRPGDRTWAWPSSFLRANTVRMVELGAIDADLARKVIEDLERAEADPASCLITPLVLEIVAERT